MRESRREAIARVISEGGISPGEAEEMVDYVMSLNRRVNRANGWRSVIIGVVVLGLSLLSLVASVPMHIPDLLVTGLWGLGVGVLLVCFGLLQCMLPSPYKVLFALSGDQV